MTPSTRRAFGAGWSIGHVLVLAAGLLAAVVVRAALLPTPGLTGDLDQFVAWVHGLATEPFGRAFDQNPTFGPVMIYIWGALAAVEPAFRTVTDSADPAIRALMKTPASIADLGLALGVAWALRRRPTWAVAGALAIALHPAVIDVSAWWGQYESIYVLAAFVAFLFAAAGRPSLAAAALAVALMTKPQALPLAVPFAGWFVGRFGVVGSLRYALVGLATVAVLWIPFLAYGGPIAYARNLAAYQDGVFAVLSLRAWNPWWLVQEAFGHGEFIADGAQVLGPITLRHVGYAIALLLEIAVFVAVMRRPIPQVLALALAASALVAFVALTTMHERYAYPALVFLAIMLPDRRVLALWLVFSGVFTLNLLAAAPPTEEIARLLPAFGPLGVIGSLVVTVCAVAALRLLLPERRSWAAE